MKKILLAIFIISTTLCFSQQTLNIIPEPANAEEKEGTFTITSSTRIAFTTNGIENSAGFLNNYLKKYYGLQLSVIKKNVYPENTIYLDYDNKHISVPGYYTMNVNKDGVSIKAHDPTGVFYGIQTLLQLLPTEKSNNLTIQQCSIVDSPRFAYRGLHLDCGRHFFPVDFIKQYIDFIAMSKMNTFHWHLTEDQGWRIEIKKYPKLTQVGDCRNGTIIGHAPGMGNDSIKYCGYYTQEIIKDIVKYAADRYITIIPEIEMPGHSSAAIAAYPELSCFPNEPTKVSPNTSWYGPVDGKEVQETWGVFPDVFCPTDYTFKFIEDVLDEVMQLFPSKYIHIGGDECPKDYWKRSDFCQKLIKEKGLKDEHGLQSYFIQTIEKYLNSKGRQIIGWDEILEGGLAPNATVMSWRGEQGGIDAAKQHHTVIMTPGDYVYFDHAQSKKDDSVTIGGYLPLETVYKYEPVPKQLGAEEAKYVLGAQANVWSEYMANVPKVEYMIFPRLAALSEVLWSPKEKRDWNDFQKRLLAQLKRYELWKVNYSKAYFDLKTSITPTENHEGVYYSLESKYKDGRIVTSINNGNTETYTTPLMINQNKTVWAALEDGKQNKVINQATYTFFFNKATGKKITVTNPPSTYFSKDANEFALVDGLKAPDNAGRSASEWLMFDLGKDLEATVDLNKKETIQQVTLDILPSTGSFIKIPQQVDVYSSDNGANWKTIASQKNENEQWNNQRKITLSFFPVSTQYVKVKAYNQIPQGVENRGGIFVDEIEVN